MMQLRDLLATALPACHCCCQALQLSVEGGLEGGSAAGSDAALGTAAVEEGLELIGGHGGAPLPPVAWSGGAFSRMEFALG